MNSFNRFLLAASPVSRVTASLVREACRALELSRAAFFLVNPQTGTVKGAAGHRLDCAEICRLSEPVESSPMIAAAVASGVPTCAPSGAEGGALSSRHVAIFGGAPVLCVPVGDRRPPSAVMLLDRGGESLEATDELIRAARCVGASLGLALRAARAYEEADRGEPARAEALGPALNARQRQIFGLLARGLSNKEISATTGLSVFTVRDHVSSLLRCLEVSSRAGAVARGWELGLLGRRELME